MTLPVPLPALKLCRASADVGCVCLLKPTRILFPLLCLLGGAVILRGGSLPFPWANPGDSLNPPFTVPADYSFSNILLFPPVEEVDTSFLDSVDPGLFLMTGNTGNARSPQLLTVGAGTWNGATFSFSLDSNQGEVNGSTPEPRTGIMAASVVAAFLSLGWRRRNITSNYGSNTS